MVLKSFGRLQELAQDGLDEDREEALELLAVCKKELSVLRQAGFMLEMLCSEAVAKAGYDWLDDIDAAVAAVTGQGSVDPEARWRSEEAFIQAVRRELGNPALEASWKRRP